MGIGEFYCIHIILSIYDYNNKNEKGKKDFSISNEEFIFRTGAKKSEKKVKSWMKNENSEIKLESEEKRLGRGHSRGLSIRNSRRNMAGERRENLSWDGKGEEATVLSPVFHLC